MDLHTAGHRRGVVAAPHPAAAEAGRAILAEGGNAIEAMVAMAAAIAVVYPHMNQIGGDGFWLVRESSGRIRALMAAGAAGSLARPERYHDAGLDHIPARGPQAALTVPGAIAGWMLGLEVAQAQGGRLPLAELLGPAMRHAREGFAVSRNQAGATTLALRELQNVPGFAQTFLIDGKPPAVGALLRQPALAATLEQLAHAGLDDFYRGDIGREIAADLDRIGSPVTRGDLERMRASLAQPLSVELGSATVFNTPPPTPGVASLIILALFDRLKVPDADGFDHIHGLIEAAKRAFAIRDRVVTDAARLPERFLAADGLDRELRMIDRRKATRWPVAAGAGDTVWMGAADMSGRVVSYIQSLYWEFGSGCVLPATGVLMQNRGVAFSLEHGALNALEPGRVPPHTLNPALAVLRDGRVMAYGTMGGDAQPQVQALVFTRHVMFCQPLAAALDAPRCVLGQTWGAPHASVVAESRCAGELLDRLSAAGHDVDVLDVPYADAMGHAGAVVLHPDGTLEGAHDPRADGAAAGI